MLLKAEAVPYWAHFFSLAMLPDHWLGEVGKVMELILVLPATTASAERSFSRMKLIKTPLRSTMSQEKLNHFMLIGPNPDLVNEIDSTKIAKEFVDRCYDNTHGGIK